MRKTVAPVQTRLFGPAPRKSEPVPGEAFRRGETAIHFDRAENLYGEWPAPTCIISDGPYGLNDIPLCGIKTVFWRQFLKAFQESSTDEEARAAIERLRERIRDAVHIPSPKAQAALTIVAELERILETHA